MQHEGVSFRMSWIELYIWAAGNEMYYLSQFTLESAIIPSIKPEIELANCERVMPGCHVGESGCSYDLDVNEGLYEYSRIRTC